MGHEHLGRLILYGVGVSKNALKRKPGNSDNSLKATDDVVQQMQDRRQKKEKEMEEQKKTMRHEAITNVIAQLQNAGLIDQNILATLFVRPPREISTSTQTAFKVIKLKEMKAVLKT
uniref:Uncharacterized protein n=1 Tax=Solanum lycopersicum TaxID=4081 RepID=A0A3Q7I1C4_SOLLC